jgi:hypothetical protein
MTVVDVFGIDNSGDGLNQKSTHDHISSKDMHGTPSVTVVRISLPVAMSPVTWDRHMWSHQTIFDILVCFPGKYAWLLCLLMGIPIAPSSIKLSFATESDMLIGSKSIALRKLSKFIRSRWSSVNINTNLAHGIAHIDHVPILPVEIVSVQMIQYMYSLIPTSMNIFHPITCKGLFKFYGQDWLPVRIEGNAVLAHRVVDDVVYKQLYRTKNTLVTTPYTLDNERKLLEDAVIFTSDRITTGNIRGRGVKRKTLCTFTGEEE